MNSRIKRDTIKACIVLFCVACAVSMVMTPTVAMGKSLYVIADVKANSKNNMQPIQAYDIGIDGTLTFQAQENILYRSLGAVGMAIDSDSGYLFITYERYGEIQLINSATMMNEGTVMAPDISDPAGIVYDHKKKLLYIAERGENLLYVYNWDSKSTTLSQVDGSPFELMRASGYGIALDEVNGLLYMANDNNYVTVYNTSDWKLNNVITLSRVAISIAVDVRNGLVYTGAGYEGNKFLTQYHLATGIKREVQVEPDGGVMGLGVDQDSGLVYMSTGQNNAPGGDNLLVYDMALKRIELIPQIGNPVGLAIPNKNIGYNPLNLRKTIIRGASIGPDGTQRIAPGSTITYGIHFNNDKDFTATEVSILDVLPSEVTFVSAETDGATGLYSSNTHTYQWYFSSVPPGKTADLELTAQVRKDARIDKMVTNSVTLTSKETPRTTAGVGAMTMYNPLNLTKTIFGAVEDQVAGVDINDTITYTICFDNNDNNFPVTGVSIIDVLPDEVSFVAAGEGKSYGAYDPNTHTFAWSYPLLKSGASACLGLVVRVNPDVPPGTTITNSAIIDSNETPPGTASVDVITYFSPLTFSMGIVGAIEGLPYWVNSGDKVTYTLRLQNKNDSELKHVSIVDTLPKEVTFVRARTDDIGVFGRYDAKTHTYTWTYDSLQPGKAEKTLDLVVEVNKGLSPGTAILNTATIDSDETRPFTARAEARTYYNALTLSKIVVGSVVGETEYVDSNEAVVYDISFENRNDSALTNVSVMDTLPKDLSFVSVEGDGASGKYDSKAHTCTWVFPSVAARATKHLKLVTQVKPGLAAGKTMTNLATINSDQTPPANASADVVMGQGSFQIQQLRIVPDVINRRGGTYEVQAIAVLPSGIGKDAVKNTLPTLYPGRVKAKRQMIYGTATTAKVVGVFDKAEMMNAISENGRVKLKMVGKLKDGRSFYGEATVNITP